ncbi:Hypothetical predicted protein [Mytilus galloprovincialis]|uniref:MAM domain-containing protein n=1 Tax=Mytilus galloprovincialis TaxID=29158 RepID=A0A8B6G3J7_MYTGA|nr:Hypothetical predicted protein [Mytilus galloprovincialis]
MVEVVTTIRHPEQNAVNISCWNTSIIQIRNITVHAEKTSCGPNQCVLNSKDTQTIEDNCNGASSCLMDYNFTSACLRSLRYINLSYTCKHENGTSVSTFKKDFGDWVVESSNNFKWDRTAGVLDHTGVRGHSITAINSYSTTGNARINTVKEFREPICLSLWYQLYSNSNAACSFSIYKTYDGTHTLIFTTEGKSTSLRQWINISVDVYEQVPFKLSLVANFYYSSTVRHILVDDTSIAYRQCEGQTVDTTCQDVDTPIRIECETQFLAGDIALTFQQETQNIHKTDCQEKSIEKDLNIICRNIGKSDQCKFTVSDSMNKYKDCIMFNKNISVTYECIKNSHTTTNMEISTESRIQSEVIAAGVSGGLLVIIIAVCVIRRIKRGKVCHPLWFITTSKYVHMFSFQIEIVKGQGRAVAKPGKASNAFDGLQYDDERQLNPSSSQCLGQEKMSKSNANVYLPKNLDQSGKELADLYNISDEDGTYDVSSNKKQLKPQNDNNIYSHTADNIYDSGSHHKLTDRNEHTYDHFFGKQTEDEYDTTTRT